MRYTIGQYAGGYNIYTFDEPDGYIAREEDWRGGRTCSIAGLRRNGHEVLSICPGDLVHATLLPLAASAVDKPSPWSDYRSAPTRSAKSTWRSTRHGRSRSTKDLSGRSRFRQADGIRTNNTRRSTPGRACGITSSTGRSWPSLPMQRASVSDSCGAVHYGAEIAIDGRKIGEHVGCMTPITLDLTAYVTPGRTTSLQVKAFHRKHYGHPVCHRTGRF